MYYKRSRSNGLGQGHSVKTSSDRQIIALVREIGIAESNGPEAAKCQLVGMRRAQYKIVKNSTERLVRAPEIGRPQVAMHKNNVLCESV